MLPQLPILKETSQKLWMNSISIFLSTDLSRYVFYNNSDIAKLYLFFALINKVIDVHCRKQKIRENKNANHISYHPSPVKKLMCFPYAYYMAFIFPSLFLK